MGNTQVEGLDYGETFFPFLKRSLPGLYFLWSLPINEKFIRWVFTMHFFMVIFKKKFTLSYFLDFPGDKKGKVRRSKMPRWP